MNELKLKKISWQRRRFIKSHILANLTDGSDVYEDLKNRILTETAYQLVGHKVIIEMDSKADEGSILVEVVGVPKQSFPSIDMEAREVLVFDHDKSAFDVDFLTLKSEAKTIMSGISYHLDSTYHIVFDGHHLALHFFI